MAPLNQNARIEGHKAMEKALTAAARVRRRFKAGRPSKIVNVQLTPLDALHRVTTEADKARNLMREEGLSPNDISCALIYCAPESPGRENVTRYMWLPEPDRMPEFFTAISKIAKAEAILFLGILWRQIDREASQPFVWVTQFLAGQRAEEGLFSARDHFISGGHRMLDN